MTSTPSRHSPCYLALAFSAAIAAGCIGNETPSQPAMAVERSAAGTANAATVDEHPTAPENCQQVSPGEPLQQAIDDASSGEALCLESGTYDGPIIIRTEQLEIWGAPDTIIRNPGEGSSIRIGADGVEIHGTKIVGSGTKYTEQDAGVFLLEADDVVLERLTMRDVLFGISAQKANGLRIFDNDIKCRAQRALGMRGDGIRFWEVRRSIVRSNLVRKCRDLVVWYSPDNYFAGNRYYDGRYGTHFMYSSRNIVRDSTYVSNSVGIFVMYSRDILLEGNVFAASAGSSGMGVGLKESGNLEILENIFADNAEGLYVDTSPLQQTDHVLLALNQFRINDVGVVFHSEPFRLRADHNTFRGNRQPVRIDGGGTAVNIPWHRNYFATYQGYDLDDDGIGDIPFELRSLTNMLTGKYPQIRLLTGTPAMALVETAARIAPLYRPDSLLRDPEPSMAPPTDGTTDELYERIREERGILRLKTVDDMPVVRARDDILKREY